MANPPITPGPYLQPWPAAGGVSVGPRNPAQLLTPGGALVSAPGLVVPSAAPPVFDLARYAFINGTLTAAVGIASVLVLDEPVEYRNFLLFRNSSATQTLYINFNAPATTDSGIILTAGQTFLFDAAIPQGDVFALSSAVGGTLSIMQGVIKLPVPKPV